MSWWPWRGGAEVVVNISEATEHQHIELRTCDFHLDFLHCQQALFSFIHGHCPQYRLFNPFKSSSGMVPIGSELEVSELVL